jgi:hypothetical protein
MLLLVDVKTYVGYQLIAVLKTAIYALVGSVADQFHLTDAPVAVIIT